MAHALIVDGDVVQLDLTDDPPDGYIEVPDFVQPGYRLVDGNFELPINVSADPPMPALTQRQLWLTALQAGITEEMVVAAVKQISDAEEREWTLIEIRKSQDYVYDHPAISKIRTMMGLPEEQFKVMWRWAATL